MESGLRKEQLAFETLLWRLIFAVNLRIKNGEYTERGLARILGISQPQMHNVLKGARTLQVQLADRLMLKLGISILQLLEQDELTQALRSRVTARELELPALKKPVRNQSVAFRRQERVTG